MTEQAAWSVGLATEDGEEKISVNVNGSGVFITLDSAEMMVKLLLLCIDQLKGQEQ